MFWVSIIIAGLSAAATATIPAVTELVKENPAMAALLNSLVILLAALAKSPLGQRPPQDPAA